MLKSILFTTAEQTATGDGTLLGFGFLVFVAILIGIILSGGGDGN